MKNIKYLIAMLVVLISACDIEDQFPSKVVDVTYPLITLKGDSVVSIPVGGTYTDAGATLTDDLTGAVTDITADEEGTVDVNTPGLYFVTYTAGNANGFRTIKQRPVAVTDVDTSWDLSGEYERIDFDVFPVLTEVANGLYFNSNIGGSNGTVYYGYMAQLDDTTLVVPIQYMYDGTTLEGLDPTLTVSGDTVVYTYVVDNVGFGPAVRVFTKVP